MFNQYTHFRSGLLLFYSEVIYPDPPLEINIKELERFPNLSLLEVDIQEWLGRASRIIDTLRQVPQDIDLYVSYGGSTKKYIRQLPGIRNLKRLDIYSRELGNWEVMHLVGAKNLKRLKVKMGKYKPFQWSIWILQIFLPDCDITLSVY